jgi:hypothetical protein
MTASLVLAVVPRPARHTFAPHFVWCTLALAGSARGADVDDMSRLCNVIPDEDIIPDFFESIRSSEMKGNGIFPSSTDVYKYVEALDVREACIRIFSSFQQRVFLRGGGSTTHIDDYEASRRDKSHQREKGYF